ncbi:MAG: sigma-70 family RNA polymerase sigma factor [Candidatus Aminicenantes bacterium]|nr:sigma-70 family RNA polymerase sigma factor [Candidatus Aminicenantes bacterium]
MKQLSDEELVLKAQAGSHPCFEELVCRYSRRLFHFLRPRMSTDQDTEDLVQETFLKIYRYIDRFDQRYKFSTWLYTTASRLVISYYRKQREKEPVFETASSAAGPQEQMLKDESHQNLWQAARALQKNQYQALWLRYMEDMPVEEIARVLKRTRLHVRVLLHRARSNLVKGMGQPALSEEGSVAPVEENLSFLS